MKLFIGALLVGHSAAFTSNDAPRAPAAPARPSPEEFRLHVQSLVPPRRPALRAARARAGRGPRRDAPPASAVGRARPVVRDATCALESDERDPHPLARLAAGYRRLQAAHYLPVAFLQAGVLAGSADAATQVLEGGAADPAHVAAMVAVAACMSGAANAAWLAQLEDAFPGTAAREVACKTLLHATIVASVINGAYLVCVPLLAAALHGAPAEPAWSGAAFLTLTKLELLMFVPYNAVAFKYVPPAVRPLTHAAISATFNVAVSAVTLGFFDRWCAEALHLLPW